MGKENTGHIDYFLLAAVAGLLIIGILALASAASIYSQREVGKTAYFFTHQLIYGLGAGIILGFIAYKLPISFWKKTSFYFVLITLGLMFLTFIPGLGINVNGAPRWINFRFSTFQPAELLKLSFIIYLSAWLSGLAGKVKDKNKDRKNWRFTLLPFLFVLGLVAGLLYFQSDAGTLMLIFAIALIMYFLAGTPLWHTALIFLLGIFGLFILIRFTAYRLSRFNIMIESIKDPFLIKDPMGIGYQIKQALITIGSGGIFGLGLGMSNQKIGQFLPHIMSDSVFTIYAEETGFIGVSVMMALFFILFWRGFRVAGNSRDKFCQLFAVGVSSWFLLQALVNIGAMIGILPLTGIPLPFISYGGSHIVAELVATGILLNISSQAEK